MATKVRKKKKRTTINKQSSRRDGKQQRWKSGGFDDVSVLEVRKEVYFISKKLRGRNQNTCNYNDAATRPERVHESTIMSVVVGRNAQTAEERQNG